MLRQIHDRHAGNFTDPPLQITIACCDDVTFMLGDSLHNTIVSVGALMHARQPLKRRILCDFQCYSELGPEFFEFGHHAVRDARRAFRVQAVHHRFSDVEFVLDGKIDEICIDDGTVRRSQLFVVFEK